MGVSIYDEAVVNKIQKWIKDPDMTILKPNETSRLWNIKADRNNDNPLELPIIAISRDPNISLDVAHQRELSANGVAISKTEEATVQLNAIPINLTYQLDIYTKKYEEGDAYLRNFIYNLVNYPTLWINIPFNGVNINHSANIMLEPEVADNSDIAEKLFPDQFTRWTIRFKVNDAFLFSAPSVKNKRIGAITLEIKTKNPNDLIVEVLYPEETEIKEF